MTDGRNQRVVRSKAAIMAAARRLMVAGTFRPTAEHIAMDANVSVRTVFDHYPSVESVYQAALYDNATFQAVLDIAMGHPQWRDFMALPIGAGDRIVIGLVYGRLPV